MHIEGVYSGSAVIGDTTMIKSFSRGCTNGAVTCTFVHLNGGVITKDTGLYYSLIDLQDYGLLRVLFAPTHVGIAGGIAVQNVECSPGSYCISPFYYDSVYGYALSDSFPKIRPQGWSILMRPDSTNKNFSSRSIPTFDNPISDTTTFSNFSMVPANGASCAFQTYDSVNPINEYVALPFVRKHTLSLIISSPNYLSFDTVIFSVRMRHSGVDSIIRYALPVTWEAPLAVSQNKVPMVSYALPNPFSNEIAVGFSLSSAETIRATLFDVTGRELRSEEQLFSQGTQEIKFDTRSLPPGSYYYVLRGAEWNRTGKLVKIAP